MSKEELEVELDEARKDIGHLLAQMTEMELRLAYLNGVIDGAGIEFTDNDDHGPLVRPATYDEYSMTHTAHRDDTDTMDINDMPKGMDLKDLIQKKHAEKADCSCSVCRDEDIAAEKEFGAVKMKNLKTSSKQNQKWASEHGVDVEKGDCNDN